MQVHICSPYSLEKNLGKAYNETMQFLPDDWWACFHDIDTLFLTPDCGVILHEYAKQNPDAGILTCFTNRISPLSSKQMLQGMISEISDIKHHIHLAEVQRNLLYSTREINRDISGMLMMVSKATWKEYPFPEDRLCLGVDTVYGRTIRAAGKKILRCNGLYIWHTYRIMKGISHKEHLQ